VDPQPPWRLEPAASGPAFSLPILGLVLPLRLRGGPPPPDLRLRLRWQGDVADTLLGAPCQPTADGVELRLALPAGACPPGEHRLDIRAETGAGVALARCDIAVHVLGLTDPMPAEVPGPLLFRATSLAQLPAAPPGALPGADALLDAVPAAPSPRAAVPAEDLARLHAAGAGTQPFLREVVVPGRAVALLHDAAVLGPPMLLASPRGVVEELLAVFRPRPHPIAICRQILGPRPEPLRLDTAAVTLLARRDAAALNHFHFHAEHLAALLQVEAFRAARPGLAMQTLLPDYGPLQREAVEMLAPDLGPTMPLGAREVVARRLLVPSLAFPTRANLDPLAGEALRRIRAAAGPADGPPLVYLSRLGAPRRRLLNEGALVAAMRARGFAIFDARGMTYREQVRAFAGARVIAGPHGAAFTNMGFAPPGALVVEILPAFYVPSYFVRLAGIMGHRYRCFTQPAEATRPGEWPWTLDLDAFLRFLDPLVAAG
jgi:capsular polysaccharide biosynthesis protein